MKKFNSTLTVILAVLLFASITACDDDSSNPISNDTDNNLPTCSISEPIADSQFERGQEVLISVAANDSDGSISGVRFYVDGYLKFTDNSAPYEYIWKTENESVGSHIIKTVAADNKGGEAESSLIVKLSMNYGYSEFFSNGFVGAGGLEVDDNNNMYVANSGTNQISLLTPAGQSSLYVGVNCERLFGIKLDDQGNIFAAGGDRVVKIDAQRNQTVVADGFANAKGITLDKRGNIYVCDASLNTVYKIDGATNEKTVFIPSDIDILTLNPEETYTCALYYLEESDDLFVSRRERGEVNVFHLNPDGTAGNKEIILTSLSGPQGVFIDNEGIMYITTMDEGKIYKVTGGSNIEELTGGTFSKPACIVQGKNDFDKDFLYVTDYGLNKVFRIYIGKVLESSKK